MTQRTQCGRQIGVRSIALRAGLLSLIIGCQTRGRLPDPVAPGPRPNVTISGVVTDAESGEPIGEALVCWHGVQMHGRSIDQAGCSNKAATGPTGQYRFSMEARGGVLRITVNASGYQPIVDSFVGYGTSQKTENLELKRDPALSPELARLPELAEVSFRVPPETRAAVAWSKVPCAERRDEIGGEHRVPRGSDVVIAVPAEKSGDLNPRPKRLRVFKLTDKFSTSGYYNAVSKIVERKLMDHNLNVVNRAVLEMIQRNEADDANPGQNELPNRQELYDSAEVVDAARARADEIRDDPKSTEEERDKHHYVLEIAEISITPEEVDIGPMLPRLISLPEKYAVHSWPRVSVPSLEVTFIGKLTDVGSGIVVWNAGRVICSQDAMEGTFDVVAALTPRAPPGVDDLRARISSYNKVLREAKDGYVWSVDEYRKEEQWGPARQRAAAEFEKARAQLEELRSRRPALSRERESIVNAAESSFDLKVRVVPETFKPAAPGELSKIERVVVTKLIGEMIESMLVRDK